ncbi:hypothetical protein CCACVL1_23592 [Corchorus capsularis]|uniref:Uncharacterized protein n=1 Tax=Corchorus capsularis TaxID=210143 RepID=A0A1R3GTF1_COCAP|nr:hypothetical protein CCACVL1_23592 [Corchorus capsularis]
MEGKQEQPNVAAMLQTMIQRVDTMIDKMQRVKEGIFSLDSNRGGNELALLSLVDRRTLRAYVKGDVHRENLFHTRMYANGKPSSVIIDEKSCKNIVSDYLVKELALPTTKHPKPYSLGCFNDREEFSVDKQVLVTLSLGKYKGDVLCDVLPMQACHVLLGRPWQFDNKVHHDGETNKYSFMCGKKPLTLIPLSLQEALKDQIKVRDDFAKLDAEFRAKEKSKSEPKIDDCFDDKTTLVAKSVLDVVCDDTKPKLSVVCNDTKSVLNVICDETKSVLDANCDENNYVLVEHSIKNNSVLVDHSIANNSVLVDYSIKNNSVLGEKKEISKEVVKECMLGTKSEIKSALHDNSDLILPLFRNTLMGTNNLAGDIPSNIMSLLSDFVEIGVVLMQGEKPVAYFCGKIQRGFPPIKDIEFHPYVVQYEFIESFPYVVQYKQDLRTNLLQGGGNDAPKAYHGRNDTPRTYHGLEDKHGEHGKDVQGLQGSMKMYGDHGDIDNHVPSTKKMPFDPLKMSNSPMTRARAKRFKDALMGLVRTHLEDLKTIEVQLKSFGDDLGKKLQINYKFITLLAIDSRLPD